MKGQPEWVMQPDDYDYQQEVARAAFADMLHDEERVTREQILTLCNWNLVGDQSPCLCRRTSSTTKA